jgi:hypothetical protein
VPSVTVVVWLVPDWSTYVTLIFAPGFFASTTVEIVVGDDTVRPSIDAIASPAARPAEAAGPPDTTPATSAPDPDAVPNPKPAASSDSTWTPRNAVAPMWTVADALP